MPRLPSGQETKDEDVDQQKLYTLHYRLRLVDDQHGES
jgi:hypothetical protein